MQSQINLRVLGSIWDHVLISGSALGKADTTTKYHVCDIAVDFETMDFNIAPHFVPISAFHIMLCLGSPHFVWSLCLAPVAIKHIPIHSRKFGDRIQSDQLCVESRPFELGQALCCDWGGPLFSDRPSFALSSSLSHPREERDIEKTVSIGYQIVIILDIIAN